MTTNHNDEEFERHAINIRRACTLDMHVVFIRNTSPPNKWKIGVKSAVFGSALPIVLEHGPVLAPSNDRLEDTPILIKTHFSSMIRFLLHSDVQNSS